MLAAGFKPAIPADDRPQTLALDGSATGMTVELRVRTDQRHNRDELFRRNNFYEDKFGTLMNTLRG